jgi:Mn-dependent DtxR family transcriptional regulator
MPRGPQPERLEAIYQAVEKNPGERPGTIAQQLGLNRSEVTRALPALEARGYLLAEDERGGLWPFRRGKRLSIGESGFP